MFRNTLYDQYRTVRVFLRSGSGAGTVLFIAAIAACLCANSGLAAAYEHFLHLPISISAGSFKLEESLAHWVNDGLMAVFFLLVGLEIKREMLTGELSSVRLALLPTIAAVGGMVVPALIFTGLNFESGLAMRAWAVPTATDIAFSLGVLALLGSRVPLQVKVFLTAVAVIDDLGAIAIIAFFYSSDLKLALLGVCLGILAVMFALNFLGVKTRLPYILLGVVMWVFMLKSGVHATIAGVFTALAIPHGRGTVSDNTPLLRLEHALHTPVNYLILPVFAFANAGVNLEGIELSSLFLDKLPLGVTLGLFIGKPIGICTAVYLAVRSGLCPMPRNTNWSLLFGVSLLCGIGFTVSLFIGNLAFTGIDPGQSQQLVNLIKAGVLIGSLISGICGAIVMHRVIKNIKMA